MIQTYETDMQNIKKEIEEMANSLLEANETIVSAMKVCDPEIFEEAKKHIKNITKKTNDVDNDLIKILALYNPEAKDLRQTAAYLKITTELLRAATNTRSFIRGFVNICEEVDIDTINQYALPLQKSATKAIKIIVDMIHIDDSDEIQDCFNEVLIEENKTDDMYGVLEKIILNHSTELDDFEKIHGILRAFRKSAKIADRTMSIANLLVYIQVGGTLQKV